MLKALRTVLRAASCLFVAVLMAAPAAAKFDSAFTWTTLETPHFYIHYHQGGENLAKRTAVIAEDVHARLVPRIRWEPKNRTHLVLVDATDNTNGLTTTFPYNHITLYITPPAGEPGFGSHPYNEWMRTLITHEYTHVLQLDMIYGGLGGVMQSVFGRLYFPNQLEPVWMIEGLAVYEETEQTDGGRNRSPGAEMVIRMAVLEDRFPRMGQAAVFPDSWPAHETPYLFGGAFTRFIAERYGREKLADISVAYSGRVTPFLVESTARQVLQKKYDALWDEWLDELTARYARVRGELSDKGLTASLPLTRRGYVNAFPAFSPDGARIAYVVRNADEFPGVFVMNADGTGDRRLVNAVFSSTSSGESIAWGPDNRGIYYTRMELRDNTNTYNDIYYFDLQDQRETPLTSGLRARDPFPSPDGKKLVFVTSRLGRTRLALLDLSANAGGPAQETSITSLTNESENQFETPRFSPDGALIAVGVRRPGGYKDIWILDSRGNKLEEVMHDRAIDGNAAWSPDGAVLYFDSDRTGIFNLYAYELATKKIFQVTNVLGGAFTPAPSPDNRSLVFASYSSNGFDLHRQPADSAFWKPAGPYTDPYPVLTYDEKPVETKTVPYNPLPTLYPRYWLPWFSGSEESGTLLGFITSAQDAVERHSYSLMGLHSPVKYRTWYSFNYFYDGFYPTFHIGAQDTDTTYSGLLVDGTGTRNYTERSTTIGVSCSMPLLRFEQQQTLRIGYRRNAISALTPLPPWTDYRGAFPAEGVLASGQVSYRYNNANQYGFSISPEDGRTIELGFKRSDRSFGGDFNVSKYTADWHEYIDVPFRHHVLLARGFAGSSSGDALPQRAFHLGGDNPGDMTIPVDNETVFLRGYPANAFRGRKVALATLEYRFPVANLEMGIGNKPVFFRRLHGAFFAESGDAWENGFHLDRFKSAVGAEGLLDLDLAYTVPITFRLGLAKGLDETRELMLIFSIRTPELF